MGASTEPAIDAALSVEEAFRRYHGSLTRFLQRRLGSAEDAADAAQETYTRLLQSYREGINGATASTLIFRIATNVANDVGRRRRTHRDSQHCAIEDVELISSEPSHERQLTAEKDLAALYEAIEALPPKCQQAFPAQPHRSHELPRDRKALRHFRENRREAHCPRSRSLARQGR